MLVVAYVQYLKHYSGVILQIRSMTEFVFIQALAKS